MPTPRLISLRRLLGWRYLFAVNFLVLAFLAAAFGREFIRTREIQGEIDLLRTKAQELAARNLQIVELSTAFQTESFIEREARLKLGLKRAGEEVVVVRGTGRPESAGEQYFDPILAWQAEQESRVDNPTKWWYYFFKQDEYQKLTKSSEE